jgi:hypothetical protein
MEAASERGQERSAGETGVRATAERPGVELRTGLRFLSRAQCAAEVVVALVLSCCRQIVVVELRFTIYFIKNKIIVYFYLTYNYIY